MKPLIILTLATVGLTGCFRAAPPTNAVPCIALKPRTDAGRAVLRQHPETPKPVGEWAAAIILGTEAVCK
jgi:hypothetical protein